MAPGETGRFLTGSTMGHVARMTFTGMAGISFLFLVDFLTLFYVTMLGDDTLTAGVGFAWGVQFFTVSFGIGLSIATTALVSREIGAGRRERARRLAGASLLIAAATLASVALVVVLFRAPILTLIGATGAAHATGADFLLFSVPSLPFVGFGMVSGATLRADGEARRAMLITVVSGFAAMVLGPILIFQLELGVRGAALSMVLSRVIGTVVGFRYCLGRNLVAAPSRAELIGFLRPFFAVAGPAMATQLSTPFGNVLLTWWVSDFGDSAVAGWAVASRLTVVAFGGIYALSGAIGGILGQNYGARIGPRVASAYRDALIFCAIYVVVVWIALALLEPWIVSGFGATGPGAEVIRAFCFIGAGAFVFNGAFFVANSAFNSLGRPIWSTWLNWMRDGAATPLALFAMPGAVGATGVVWAQTAAAILLGSIAVALGWRLAHRPLAPRFPAATGATGAAAAPALESDAGGVRLREG